MPSIKSTSLISFSWLDFDTKRVYIFAIFLEHFKDIVRYNSVQPICYETS